MRKISMPKDELIPIYDKWNEVKKNLAINIKTPHIKDGEVWWCSMGRNLGSEIYGKGESSTRPVLVYRKLDRFKFLAIPFSTKTQHTGSWYVLLNFGGKDQVAVLSQIRVIDVTRLGKCIGELSENDLGKIRDKFNKLYCVKNIPQSCD